MVPREAASVLGRLLSCLGAPVGQKASEAVSLPGYLDAAPDAVRRTFVDVYLRNRAQTHPDKRTVTIHEDRSRAYLEAVADLLADVSGERVTVAGNNVIVSAAAVDALYGVLGEPPA